VPIFPLLILGLKLVGEGELMLRVGLLLALVLLKILTPGDLPFLLALLHRAQHLKKFLHVEVERH
jgi:hypothetical protein